MRLRVLRDAGFAADGVVAGAVRALRAVRCEREDARARTGAHYGRAERRPDRAAPRPPDRRLAQEGRAVRAEPKTDRQDTRTRDPHGGVQVTLLKAEVGEHLVALGKLVDGVFQHLANFGCVHAPKQAHTESPCQGSLDRCVQLVGSNQMMGRSRSQVLCLRANTLVARSMAGASSSFESLPSTCSSTWRYPTDCIGRVSR